ncbi:DNA recombination protein RmuC [Taklimakanibacter deserti]|uniref:DNA recombination protein RmuC n=1 Tax=Taklimakanibacter deserti TaxID=2267839 RepID=UPI000E657696
MTLDQTILQIGGQAFNLGQILLAGAGLALLLLIMTAVLAWRSQRQRYDESLETMRRASELEFRLAEMAGQLRSFADQAQSGQQHLARTLDERLDQVSHRLGRGLNEQAERTHLSLKHLYERLAVIDTAQANLTQLSSEMVSLKDILANKQARGAYGQARMEAIIRDGLHAQAYTFQTTLSNGSRPDCLIRLPESELGLVIDAKFPLEAFNALKAATGENDIRAAETRLRRDVIHHVKDIAGKYLIAGETQEPAIMFVPSESIYADLYERFEDVLQKAHRERVIIASPNILMLLIQTMQAIFKDARMREQAGVIKIEVTRLLEDVGRLKERVLDLQRHFGQASGDLEKLGLSADKITKRGLRIEQLDVEEPAKVTAEEAQLRLVQGR